jgi:pilus assembly protein CpaE
VARNLNALIVDPNLDSRLDIVRAVERIGLDIVGETAYGTEATFMASQEHPNVILLALEEPPVRGLATLEALQQQLPDTPVLVYSSGMASALMRQAMRAGARDFLEKPVNPGDLRDAVHAVLAQEEQRQLARWSESGAAGGTRGTIITVAGAKGGIGKTTFSTNLATMLREVTGQEVALVDGDAQFGDVAVMLDVDVTRSIADLARDEVDINRHTILPYLVRVETGMDTLLAAAGPDDWRAVQPEDISAIARALAESHEYVIIDTPGVMNELVAASLNEAALVLLVTSLDVSSVKDTKTAVRILEAWGMPHERLRLFVNDSTHASAVKTDDVERATGLKVAKVIPYDTSVGLSVQTGIPLARSQPNSKYSRAVREIAESIAGITHVIPNTSSISLARLPLVGRKA